MDRKVPGLTDEWAQHQLDLLELAETICSAMDVPVEQARAVLQQEPACRWAHGVGQELDARGLCPVCAADDDEGDA